MSSRSHHRYFGIPKITGLRRPSQTASHGTPQIVEEETGPTLKHPAHYHSYNPEQSTYQHNHNMASQPRQQPRVRFANDAQPVHHNRTHSSTHSQSNGSSSNPVSNASSRTSFDLEPTGPVAEWCHQMHIMQQRRYDWCQSCYPRPVTVSPTAAIDEATMEQLRTQRMAERLRREREAGHAYQ